MATTFVKIATVTVGSGGSATIDFTSIPQTYTDLKLVLSTRTNLTATRDDFKITFNGITSGYSRRRVMGIDDVAYSQASSSQSYFEVNTSDDGITANVFGSLEVYILNYTSANQKTFSSEETSESNGSNYLLQFQGGLLANTAAITQITATTTSTTLFKQYSTGTLYGIKSS